MKACITVLGSLALVAWLLFAPAALADNIGEANEPITFSCGFTCSAGPEYISPGGSNSPSNLSLTTSFTLDGSVNIAGPGQLEPVFWSVTTNLAGPFGPTTIPTYTPPVPPASPVNMNGATANFNLNDSVGGTMFGALTWTQVAPDTVNPSLTDLIGTISLNVESFTPPPGVPDVFPNYFPDIISAANAAPAGTPVPIQITFVTSCTGANGTTVNCTVLDPVGTVVSVDISPMTPTVITPEPASLMLIGAGLAGLAVLGRRKRTHGALPLP
jgi:hypothetical protein